MNSCEVCSVEIWEGDRVCDSCAIDAQKIYLQYEGNISNSEIVAILRKGV